MHHDDPAAQAALWTSLGAGAIHVVNLDGALAYGAGTASALNLQRVKEIRRTVDVPLQFAGGLRDERDVETAIGLDVDRIVIGTAAVVRPELVAWALRRWGPERVAVALEVRAGGWSRWVAAVHAAHSVPFGGELYRMGVRTSAHRRRPGGTAQRRRRQARRRWPNPGLTGDQRRCRQWRHPANRGGRRRRRGRHRAGALHRQALAPRGPGGGRGLTHAITRRDGAPPAAPARAAPGRRVRRGRRRAPPWPSAAPHRAR